MNELLLLVYTAAVVSLTVVVMKLFKKPCEDRVVDHIAMSESEYRELMTDIARVYGFDAPDSIVLDMIRNDMKTFQKVSTISTEYSHIASRPMNVLNNVAWSMENYDK